MFGLKQEKLHMKAFEVTALLFLDTEILFNCPHPSRELFSKRVWAVATTFPQSWDMTSRRDLPLHTAGHPGRWHQLRSAVCSSTLPCATRWSEGRSAPHWKWHLRCTNHPLQNKATQERKSYKMQVRTLDNRDLNSNEIASFLWNNMR